jgi:peptidoglycan/LPS O-acetylase OafA/YrhL
LLYFYFFPAQGDQVIIVTGWNRIIFSAISILAVFVFFVCHSPDLPQLITSSLAFFGLTSYGVYLLHPIVAWYIDGVFDYIELVLLVNKLPYFRTLFSLALTMYFSAMTYKYLEMPFIIYAKRVLAIKK